MRTLRRRAAGLVLALAVSLCVVGCRFETAEEEDLERSIETMLRRSAAAWNAGDLDGFMVAFADGPSTSLITADGPVYGKEAIREQYAPLFEPGAVRDSLRVEDLGVRPLPPLIGIVTGRYVHERDGEMTSAGWFTVVVRRAGEGWRIVHDHSS